MSEHTPPAPPPTHQEIEACAYFIFTQEERHEGRALDHWLQAELQLLACHIQDAGTAAINIDEPEVGG